MQAQGSVAVPFRTSGAAYAGDELITTIPAYPAAGSEDEICDPSWYSTD